MYQMLKTMKLKSSKLRFTQKKKKKTTQLILEQERIYIRTKVVTRLLQILEKYACEGLLSNLRMFGTSPFCVHQVFGVMSTNISR